MKNFVRSMISRVRGAAVADNVSTEVPAQEQESTPTQEPTFENILGFKPAQKGSYLWYKQEELALTVVKSLARAWQIACWEEEEADRQVKEEIPVYECGNVLPAVIFRAKLAKEKAVRARLALDTGIEFAKYAFEDHCYLSKVFPLDPNIGGTSAAYGTFSLRYVDYLGDEAEQKRLKERYEAQQVVS